MVIRQSLDQMISLDGRVSFNSTLLGIWLTQSIFPNNMEFKMQEDKVILKIALLKKLFMVLTD